jgi:hypothetical protein
MNQNITPIQLLRQNLKRRQSQLQSLLELERNWPKQAETRQLPDLIRQKQQMLDNLDSLLQDAAGADWELAAQRTTMPAEDRRDLEAALENLKLQLTIILGLHQQNLANLQESMSQTGQELNKVRYELEIIRALRRNARRPMRVDVVG